jgi:glycosyltransferase involved in cell wall biosynthesis
MKVSVEIPAYNEEKYIGNCLRSLLNQTEKIDEIVVVDNNCSDMTVDVVKKFPGVKIIREKKQGMIPARNAGFDYMSGDILIKCDADTVFPENWIEEVKLAFKNNPGCTGVSTLVFFDDLPWVRKLPWLYYIYFFIPKLIIGDYPLNGPGYAITKKVWAKVKSEICLDDKKVHEDIDLSFHIKKYGRIIFIKKCLLKSSARRIKTKPQSFFGEYLIRFFRMLPAHWR